MRRLILALAVSLIAGCSPAKKAATVCTEDDCAAGLSCIAGDSTINLENGTCTATPASFKTCTKTCTTDADCAGLTAEVAGTFKCFGCPGAATCGLTGS